MMQNDTTGSVLPITADDAFIERALQDANTPSLMAAIIHLTGDTSLIDGPIRTRKATSGLDADGGLTEEQKQTVRKLALDALKSYRDRGCPPLQALSPDTINRMTAMVVGEPVPGNYLPMLYQDMRIDERFTRSEPWTAAAEERKGDFRVLIIGAGMSGLLSAIKLDELGIPYTILEKGDEVGGTWRDNTYPGCRVDLPNHFYSYSFEPNPNWSHHFSERTELLPYFKSVARKYQVEKNIQFGSEVEQARWSERDSQWHVTVRTRDGSTREVVGNVLVSAVGQLSRPKFPDIPGRETFKGRSCHTHGFDQSIAIEGKRVAVIGTAASAVQLVPELAKKAAKLEIFQRTAHWYWPVPNYHAAVASGKKWLLNHVPFYSGWYRFALFWGLTDGMRHWYKIDPQWPDHARSVNAINDQFRQQFTQFIHDQLGDRTDLIAKLIPTYPPFADRILLNNGNYLRTLTQDHVELFTSGITSIDATGITDADGVHHEVDVIIYATGFNSTKFLHPMKIIGKQGIVLNEFWNGEGQGYLGLTVPKFPNFFMVWGPGTSGGTGGSNIFYAECHVRYIRSAIQQLIERGAASIDVRRDVFEEYMQRFRAEVDTMVWTSQRVGGWYKNEKGRVVTNLPFRVIDYWTWTKSADLSDFVVEGDLQRQVPRRTVA
jgi:4-hydroxyacetophenone monooxygenase